MPSITFDLETVTPLFLSGADQTIAELRPPAFRGALRYWFRSIAGSILPIDQVRMWEDKVFGSSEKGGNVVIRIRAEKYTSTTSLDSKKKEDWQGLSYLLFSIYESGKQESKNHKLARAYIPSQTKLKMVLQTRFNNTEAENLLKLAIGSAWLLFNFGGVGSRSNRGAGSIKVNSTSRKQLNDIPYDFISNFKNLEELHQYLEQGVNLISLMYKNILNPNDSYTPCSPSDFDILSEKTSSVYLWQSPTTEYNEGWAEILDDIGCKYQNFRCRYKNATSDDYPIIKAWVENGDEVQAVKRAAFGLPIIFFYSSLKKKYANSKENKPTSTTLEASLGIKTIDRISSPFKIRVIPVNTDCFVVLLIHFKTNLLPKGARLRLKREIDGRQQPTYFDPPDQSIISELIANLHPISEVNISNE